MMDGNLALIVTAALAVGIVLQRLSGLSARIERLSRMEGKLDALMRNAGVTYDPLANVPPDVHEALAGGEYVVAIKKLREAKGIGLKEAKEQIDEWRRAAGR